MAPVPSHSGRTGTERIDPCVDTGRRYHQAGQEGCLSTTALVVRRQGRWGPSQSRKKSAPPHREGGGEPRQLASWGPPPAWTQGSPAEKKDGEKKAVSQARNEKRSTYQSLGLGSVLRQQQGALTPEPLGPERVTYSVLGFQP